MNLYYSELLQVIEDKERIKKCVYKIMRKKKLMDKCPKHITMEINGIPENKHEDLRKIVTRLSRVVSADIEREEILTIERSPRKAPRPIILKLKDKKTRDKILNGVNMYNNIHPSRPLNTRLLKFYGFKSPVLVSIHPSPLNKTHREQVKEVWRAHEEEEAPKKPSQIKDRVAVEKEKCVVQRMLYQRCRWHRWYSIRCKILKKLGHLAATVHSMEHSSMVHRCAHRFEPACDVDQSES